MRPNIEVKYDQTENEKRCYIKPNKLETRLTCFFSTSILSISFSL